MVYKSLNGLSPQYLNSMFSYEVSSHSLGDSEGKLAIPPPRNSYVKSSFSYRGSVLWNSLPIELRKGKLFPLLNTAAVISFEICQ